MDRRALLGFAAGGLWVALLRGRARQGEVHVWAADRGAGRLVGLDLDLRVRETVSVTCPVALASPPAETRTGDEAPAGRGSPAGTWVASAPRSTAQDSTLQLELFDRRGRLIATSEQAHLCSMRCDAGGRLWLLRGERGCEELVAIDPSGLLADGAGSATAIGPVDDAVPFESEGSYPAALQASSCAGEVTAIVGVPGAAHFAVAPSGAWLVAQRDGTLVAGGVNGEIVAARGPRVRDVQPAAQGFWLLGEHELRLVGAKLEPCFAEPLLERPGRLLPTVGGETVWHLSANGRSVRRHALDSAQHIVVDLPLAGTSDGIGLSDGGLLLAAPGAVLRLDANGAFGAGQGGFRELSALALA